MFGEEDGKLVLAEHGQWIATLRDDARVLEQRLRSLERRLATLESNLAELTKLYGKLDLALGPISDELARLDSRVNALTGLYKGAKSRRRSG